MPDREKVIKGLEAHGCGKSMWRICNKCPYDKEEWIKDRCRDNLLADAYALLKEQEAVEPKINEYGEAFCECGENVGIIPNSEQLPSVRMKKICPECGRLLKWAGKQ